MHVMKPSIFEVYEDKAHTFAHLMEHVTKHVDDGWEMVGYSVVWRDDLKRMVHNYMWRQDDWPT